MHVVECPDCETRYDVHYSPTCPKCGARFGHYIEEPVTQSESFSNEIPLATGDTIEVKDGAVLEIIPATPADEVPVESDELEDFCNGVEGFNPLVIAEVILLFMQNCKLPDSELVDRARKPRFAAGCLPPSARPPGSPRRT